MLVYDAGGKLLAEYGPPAGSGGTQYAFADHQGSPRVITGASGNVISRHDYAPFGEELSAIGMRTSGQGYSNGDNARQKYAGMESDDAGGLAHTLWRQYDNLSGRWASPDPYGGSMSVGSPQTFNRYAYVYNDPVNQVDSTGLMAGLGYSYRGAELGWDQVEDSFWGRPDMSTVGRGSAGWSHIADAQYRLANMDIADDGDDSTAADQVGEPPPPSPDAAPTSPIGEPAPQSQGGPVTTVTILGNTVQIFYASRVSSANRLEASNAITAAAALLNKNAASLTASEKKAIAQISYFEVVGPKSMIGAHDSGMSLSTSYMKGVTPAWLASLFGHEGQHRLNRGKYSEANIWRNEQSASLVQLSIGMKIGLQAYEIEHLRRWAADNNRRTMQKHMEGVRY